jgi:hypothetical protein
MDENWISILEKLTYCFRILPLRNPKVWAAKKRKKPLSLRFGSMD